MTADEWAAVALTLRVAAVATTVSLPPGVALGYALARGRVPVPFVVENVVLLPLVVPPVVTGYTLLVLTAGSIAFSWGAAVLASAVVGFPLLVQTVRVAFATVGPDVEDAARVDGASRWTVFRRVTLPIAGRGVAAGAVLHFARGLGEFGATVVVAGNIPGRTQTLPLLIYARLNGLGGDAAMLRLVGISVALSAASLVAYGLLTRRLHAA